ncbi:formate dehydrogenase accessory protein FdhE [Ancylobacter terrae]|uniref:formate dehydrogenase accessory protein FdhE n=1 Tax=Ancylobacter sp. sgz301288 TaxID=3342077 RepID=UPI00385FC9A0
MSTTLQPDPGAIGGVAEPPFARLPDPAAPFAARAARLRALAAAGGPTAPYLGFLAALVGAQNAILPGLPEPARPEPAAVERARTHAMPPLDRAMVTLDAPLAATLDALFDAAASIAKPDAAARALEAVTRADKDARAFMIANVLADSLPVETLAEHLYVAAALQVHFARLAAGLDAKRLVPVGDGVCPACGGPPVASMVVGWMGAEGARYCGCALCGTLWNYVRIKCVSCGSTKGIGYQEVEGGAGTVKAETCDECRTYVKVLYQNKDPALEPLADDAASLGLDVLMSEGPYRRAAFNPFLLGY